MKLAIILAIGLVSQAAGHGFVKTIVADNVTYKGYDPSFQYANPIPEVPGWSDPQNLANGFVNDYGSPDLACHLAATPGKTYAMVRAGSSIQVEWTPWPDSHKGPVIDYLAACNGECTIANKTTLLWNKIAETGLLDGSTIPGKYAADALIQSGNKWTINVPSSLAPGNYVLRHEIIALHEGHQLGGAQNYPKCINIKVTGSGTQSLANIGTRFNKLYNTDDPGIYCNIYQKLTSYIIPGPALFNFTSGNISTSTSSMLAVSSEKAVIPSSLPNSSHTATAITTSDTARRTSGETATFILNSSGKAKKFVCHEEL